LGELALAEQDPLLKAVLVEGLVGGFDFDRIDDVRLAPLLDSLMTSMRAAADDPYDVARGLASTFHSVCLRSGQDYASVMSAHLAASDNAGFLAHGYLHMGSSR
jgi:hypothetical protein